MDMSDHVTRVRHLLYGHAARFGQFAAVGATGAVVDLVVFSMLMSLCTFGLARALAIWSAMSWNFLLNRWWTFSEARGGPILRQYALFCASCLCGALVNWSVTLCLHFIVTYFAERSMLAAACGIIAGAGVNYVLSAHIAFTAVPTRIKVRPVGGVRVDPHGSRPPQPQ
jgi:putative flippase GtrA